VSALQAADMTTNERVIASVLGALSMGGIVACTKPAPQTTEVPEPAKRCLHSEGCCGGHTEGDGACGAAKADADIAGATGDDGTATATAQTFEWTVAPGAFAEINLELGDGAKSSASFEADAPLAWNVHSHPSDEPVIHAEGSDSKGVPAFAADQGGAYSYLWANRSARAVKLRVELRIEGRGRVHSTHPE
jgi:hypothetical protein